MGAPDGVLIVEETGFAKKGQDAVGVARQYCGALGPVAHCHVGVGAAYASRQGSAVVDTRLFLPAPWFPEAYTARRTTGKMPAEGPWQSKPQLAAAIRIRVWKDGQPPTAVWLLMQRSLGTHPQYWDSLSNAPLRVPLRLLVWLSGVRWAIEQCCEETKTALGMDHDAVRTYPGWHHHMLACMLAHFFLWHLQLRWEKKSTRSYGLASPEVIGGGFAPQSLHGG
jgi:SRSO17 transposase